MSSDEKDSPLMVGEGMGGAGDGLVYILPPDPSNSFIPNLSVPLIQGFKEAYLAFDTVRQEAQRGHKPPLFTLSSILWKTQATLPHDKVYSLLGLMQASEAQLIAPDYARPYFEVFATATHAAIASTRVFDTLSAVILNPAADANRAKSESYDLDLAISVVRNQEQPSWCIDFLAFKRSYSTELPLFGFYSRFQGTSLAEQTRCEENRRLLVWGRFCDKITAVVDDMDSHVAGWYRQELEQTDVEGSEELQSEQLKKGEEKGEENTEEDSYSVANIVILSAIEVAEKIDPYAKFAEPHTPRRRVKFKEKLRGDWTHEFSFLNAFEVWQSCVGHAGDGIMDDGQAVDQWKMHHISIENEMASYARYVAGKLVLFTTTTGHIGIAPGGVNTGDTVVYLDGGKLPAVLRPRPGNEEGFTFYGFAYVHGTMRLSLTSEAPDSFVLKDLCDREEYQRRQFALY